MSDATHGAPDAQTTGQSGPDAHGQAAFLLLESLIHHLIASDVITNDAAIEIVSVAIDVKTEIADELGDSPTTLRRSIGLLDRVAASLGTDRLSGGAQR